MAIASGSPSTRVETLLTQEVHVAQRGVAGGVAAGACAWCWNLQPALRRRALFARAWSERHARPDMLESIADVQER